MLALALNRAVDCIEYRLSKKRKERKRKEKTTPFGVNLMRSQVFTGLPRYRLSIKASQIE